MFRAVFEILEWLMKKLICTIITAAMVLGSCPALAQTHAENKNTVDVCGNHVNVSAQTEDKSGEVTLVVTGPDLDYDGFAARNDINSAVYIDQKTAVNGSTEFSFALDSADGEYEAAVLDDEGGVIYTDKFTLGETDGMDSLTVTRTAPWMVNYHLTTEEQYGSGYAGGECGQMVWGIAVSPLNPEIVLMGTDTAGIYKSTNGAKSWYQAGLGFDTHGITGIEFHPEYENIVFAAGAAHSASGYRTELEGIWKSDDAGETWRQTLTCGFGGHKMHSFAFLGGLIYAGAHDSITAEYPGGVYVSRDLGETWENIGLSDRTINAVKAVGEKLFVLTDNGIYVMSDGGFGAPVISGNFLDIAECGGALYCINSDSLYKSADGGESWTVIKRSSEMGFGASAASLETLTVFGDALGIMSNAVPDNFVYTTDGANSFMLPEYSKKNAFVKNNSGYYSEGSAGLPDGTLIIAADGEIYKGRLDENGLVLHASSSGISGIRAKKFLFDAENPDNVMIAAVDKGFIKTCGKTETHSYLTVDYSPMEADGIRYAGEKTVCCAAYDPCDKNRILISIGSWEKSVIKESTDGGKTFYALPGSEGAQCECIEFNAGNPDIIYAGDRISRDNGKSWEKLPGGMIIDAVSPFDGNKVYAKTEDCVYVSENAGITWSLFGSGVPGIQRIHADLSEDGKLWIGTFSSGIAVMTRGGVRYMNNGISVSSGGVKTVYEVAQNPKNPQHMVAGGTDAHKCSVSAGLFESYDGGESWRTVDGLTGSKDVWAVEFHPVLPRVYVGTSSGTFVYEYERYSPADKIISCRSVSGFNIRCFAENKLILNVLTASYSSEGVLRDIISDEIEVFKNREYNYTVPDEKLPVGDVIKQFIWKHGTGEPAAAELSASGG